jgi:transposase
MYGKASCSAGSVGTDEEDPSVTIPPDLEAQILRYYHVEKWRIGTIARQLRIHAETVARVLAQAGLPRIGPPQRPSKIDPYLPFVLEMLAKFPTLTASRLHGMVWERGYRGGKSRFRAIIACHRPRPKAEAYLRLRTLPGEQSQCDWAHFGHLVIGRARRPLMAFVMVLSFSRQIFLRFFLDARMENFLRGHLGAFAAWQGIPRVILYDNLRSAVLERQGDAIRFNPTLLDFAAYYRFEPRQSLSHAAMKKVAWKKPFGSSGTHSSPLVHSPIWTISTPRPTPGAAAWPPTGAARKTRPAALARSSPMKRHDC